MRVRLLMSPDQLSPVFFFFFVSIVCLVLVVLCLFEPVTQPDSKAFLSEQLGLGPSASPQRENQACTVLL